LAFAPLRGLPDRQAAVETTTTSPGLQFAARSGAAGSRPPSPRRSRDALHDHGRGRDPTKLRLHPCLL